MLFLSPKLKVLYLAKIFIMNTQELETLLNDLESDRVERKASVSDRIRRVICAFANDLPNHQQAGVIFIGVNDDGSCANLEITDKLLLTLSDILPFPTMIVQKRILAGCELVVVIVEPSDSPPVRYEGRVWVRLGPSLALATPEEERRLIEKHRSRDLPFNIQPLVSTSLDDLNLEFFVQKYLPVALPADILEQNQRSIEQQLAAMRFVSRGFSFADFVSGNPLRSIPETTFHCDCPWYLSLWKKASTNCTG